MRKKKAAVAAGVIRIGAVLISIIGSVGVGAVVAKMLVHCKDDA